MGTTAVDVQTVSKRFRLYHEKYSSLKEKVIHAGRIPHEDLWALREVCFEVEEGETVGILGRNGSGKSTLLKCVCGVLKPTSGQVVVRGKLAGLLELGAGFQQELSGRENVYMNGSMLGLSKREVDRMFDAIVDFAELGQFIDNQVKFYSSGMYVRLGFAVAVNVDPDILVIDEVLAVGDERFQRKCMERVKQFQREGRTILFVSHSPDLVRSICDRAVVLADGVLVGQGAPGEAVRIFREHLLEAGDVLALGVTEAHTPAPAAATAPVAVAAPAPAASGTEPDHGTATAQPGSADVDPAHAGDSQPSLGAAAAPSLDATEEPREDTDSEHASQALDAYGTAKRPIRFDDAVCILPDAGARRYLLPGEPLVVRLSIDSSHPAPGTVFQIELTDSDGSVLFRTDTDSLGVTCDVAPGHAVVDLRLASVPLLDGAYWLNVGALTPRGMSDWRERACGFEVMNPGRSTGVVSIEVAVDLHAGEPGEEGDQEPTAVDPHRSHDPVPS